MYIEEIKNSSGKMQELKSHTILIYLGSIIEALTYYFVDQKIIDKNSRKKYLELEDLKKIHKIDTIEDIYICKPKIQEISLNDTINFNNLIHGLKSRNLLDKKTIDKIEYIRRKRNLIHVNVLMLNEYALFDELDKIFTYTKEIIDEIKKKLK